MAARLYRPGTHATLVLMTCGVLLGLSAPARAQVFPRFAYVANLGDNTISMYTVNATTGQLWHNGFVAAWTTANSVTADPSGRFAYVANFGSANVSAYTPTPTTGALTKVLPRVAAGAGPSSVTTMGFVAPTYTAVLGGGLTPSSPAAVLEGSTLHLFVRGVNDRLYVNSRSGGIFGGWSEVPGGGLTPNQPAAVRDSSGALRLYVQGTDTRLYVNTRTGGTWSGWSEVPGGGLTPSGPEAVLDGSQLRLFVRGTDNRVYTSTP